MYFSRKIRAHAVLVASSHLKGAEEVRNQSGLGPRLKVVEITPCLVSPLIDPRSIILALGRVRDQNKPGVIIFTSGSTGPPKAVAMRRYNVFMTALSAIRNQNITRDSRIIQLLPTHHATGLFVNTLPGILGGGCVEFNQGQFDAAETWEQFRRGDLRNFSGVPTIYTRLLRHWEIVILKMPEQEQESYRHGASKILRFESSTAPLPLNVAKAWLALTGTPIAERYGGSEFGNVYGHYSGVKIVLVGGIRSSPAFRACLLTREFRAQLASKILTWNRSCLKATAARFWFEVLFSSLSEFCLGPSAFCNMARDL